MGKDSLNNWTVRSFKINNSVLNYLVSGRCIYLLLLSQTLTVARTLAKSEVKAKQHMLLFSVESHSLHNLRETEC